MLREVGTDHRSRGWSPIQIRSPIRVRLGVPLSAGPALAVIADGRSGQCSDRATVWPVPPEPTMEGGRSCWRIRPHWRRSLRTSLIALREWASHSLPGIIHTSLAVGKTNSSRPLPSTSATHAMFSIGVISRPSQDEGRSIAGLRSES